MKKANFLFFILLSCFFIFPLTTHAFEVKMEDVVSINKDEVVEGNLYAVASSVTVEGEIDGDLICATSMLTINGKVNGDVICVANTININGPIEGSVRVIGNATNFNSSIKKNLQVLSTSINLSEKAEVGWDMLVAGENATISGLINGDLHGKIIHATINGKIIQDIKLRLDNKKNEKNALNISPEAFIGGNLYYVSGTKDGISKEAQIGGEIKHSFYGKEKDDSGFWIFFSNLASIFAALIVGLVLISLARKPIEKTISIMKNEIGPSFGFGTVALFLTPIIVVVLIITIIGIPLAVIVLLLWAILIYLSKVIFGIFIGNYIFKKYLKKKSKSLIWSMILGITIAWLVASLPFIGWIFCLTAVLWGLGAIIIFFKKQNL